MNPTGLLAADPERLRARLLSATPVRRLAGRNRTKADVLFYRLEDGDLALKDYGPRPWWIRHTLGRWLVRREVRAYRAAAGSDGLPACLGRAGPFALLMTRVAGRPLAELPRGAVDPAVFDALERVVRGLHDRGVALGDLHHRDVLVSDRGEVHVVDLATAWIAGGRPGRWRRAVFLRWRDADLVALARLRARWTGGDVAAAAESAGPRAAARHRRARRLKRWWDRLRG